MRKLTIYLSFFFSIFAVHTDAQQDADSTKHEQPVTDTSNQSQELELIRKQVQNQADSARLVQPKVDTSKLAANIAIKDFLAENIIELTSEPMHGRGYVKNGRDSAALYILRKFKEFKLQPVTKGGSFAQAYSFAVNTFPGRMELVIDDERLSPGAQFLIDASSSSFSKKNMSVKKINLKKIADKGAWRQFLATLDTNHAYYFENVDSFCNNVLQQRKSHFIAELPAGCFIIPEEGKLTWTVSRQNYPATVFYVRADVLPKKIKTISAEVTALFLPHAKSENIIGCVPGEVKDTFIALTAHYDHLGMMGEYAVFPGASDNASGSAMLLYLASYFSVHPQHYSILFIAFAGEEAALKGSEFYTQHPTVPLKNIKFLTNIDIMGDASGGVTVVNATEFPKEFGQLQAINDKQKYLPDINSRGKAANSDHYYFTEAGVPSFFMYSVGGKGYYHDVYDKAKEISLINVDGVADLLIDFVKALD